MILVKESTNGTRVTQGIDNGFQEDLELSKFLNQFQDVFNDDIPGELPPKQGDDDHAIELPPRRDDILAIVDSRWGFMRHPIHGMVAILHPFYKTPELFGDISLLTLRSEYLNLMLSEDDQLVIDGEMSSFMNNLGPTYLRSVATRSEVTRFPLSWWQNYGRQGLPQLCKLALRVLSQDCSAGACERNWSAYSLVHTKIMNRLSTSQLEKLVYCRSNMRLVRSFHALGNPKQVRIY
ncbi:hypothetical protein L7F22_032970 [Adiantum nelumboides]|nr:hypothetical protein [Adiantum nelumboides]